MIRLTVADGGPTPDEIVVNGMTYIPVCPIKRGQFTTITAEEIDAARLPDGTWRVRQLSAWGVSWPAPQGWRERLIREGVR